MHPLFLLTGYSSKKIYTSLYLVSDSKRVRGGIYLIQPSPYLIPKGLPSPI